MAKLPTNKGGRPSLFGSKGTGASRVQGVLTPRGSVRFEQARERLGKLAGKETVQISDADVIDYMSLGETKTRAFFQEQKAIAK